MSGLSTTDRERLGAILDTHRRMGNDGPEGTRPDDYISAAACERWRALRADGERPVDIATAAGVAQRTVSEHVNGRCGHGDP